ncbi:signal peptidase II [Iamia majanohamensis]|uniref:Lipoprotein signal peptidase n=1 Tax=Iamia majanohamensis TaxID=467976 RepID=A0AAE9YGA3_9ACTN|nr:signal peptidase II [Iamia majanohamensis]WCO67982.1 signal peptidase II [Iamia majanohamensis]
MTKPAGSVPRRRHVRFVVAAVAVAATDLISKLVATAYLDAEGIDLPGPLDLRLAYNSGVAFSLGRDAPTWLIITLTSGVAAAIGVVAWRGMFASSLAAGVVVGGAVANLIDRVQAGTVVDMLYTGWWPTFNLADVAVVGGAFALVITDWAAPQTTNRPRQQPAHPSE